MPRKCSICVHPDLKAIDQAIAEGISNRVIASQYRVGADSIQRHAAHGDAKRDAQGVAETEEPMSTEPEPSLAGIRIFHTGVDAFVAPLAPTEAKHEEIIAYIKARLGGGLATLYDESIRSSVSTGCYDYTWNTQAPPYAVIENYITVLKQHYLQRRGDSTALLERLFHLQDFGTAEEKGMLAALGLLPDQPGQRT